VADNIQIPGNCWEIKQSVHLYTHDPEVLLKSDVEGRKTSLHSVVCLLNNAMNFTGELSSSICIILVLGEKNVYSYRQLA
jgi:hypothetical protein